MATKTKATPVQPDDMIPVSEAADILKVTSTTILSYVNDGSLLVKKISPRFFMVSESAVRALKLRPRGRPWPKVKAVAK